MSVSVEQQVLDLINARRINCTPLRFNTKLQKAALDRSTDNAQNNRLVHTNLGIIEPVYGYHWNAIAENIAFGQQTAQEVVNAWMNSPAHKANILNCTYQDTGIAKVGNYWTQIFGKQ